MLSFAPSRTGTQNRPRARAYRWLHRNMASVPTRHVGLVKTALQQQVLIT